MLYPRTKIPHVQTQWLIEYRHQKAKYIFRPATILLYILQKYFLNKDFIFTSNPLQGNGNGASVDSTS